MSVFIGIMFSLFHFGGGGWEYVVNLDDSVITDSLIFSSFSIFNL